MQQQRPARIDIGIQISGRESGRKADQSLGRAGRRAPLQPAAVGGSVQGQSAGKPLLSGDPADGVLGVVGFVLPGIENAVAHAGAPAGLVDKYGVGAKIAFFRRFQDAVLVIGRTLEDNIVPAGFPRQINARMQSDSVPHGDLADQEVVFGGNGFPAPGGSPFCRHAARLFCFGSVGIQ